MAWVLLEEVHVRQGEGEGFQGFVVSIALGV